MVSYANLTGRLATLAGALAGVALAGCAGPDSRSVAARMPDSTGPRATDSAPPPSGPRAPTPAGFRTIAIDGPAPYRALVRRLGEERLTLVQKLNRIDAFHVRAGDSLILPIDTLATELALAPFPIRLAGLDSVPRFLVISQRIQAFAAYELGHLVYWGPTSTGKQSTPTPNGLFFTNWKARETRSTENDAWLLRWYVNLDNRRGVSLHEYDLPGYPASHACIRLLPTDAEWIYRWADQWVLTRDGTRVLVEGTPVLLFGQYAWGTPGPWRRLPTDPAAATVSPSELADALAPVLERIQRETRRRDSSR